MTSTQTGFWNEVTFRPRLTVRDLPTLYFWLAAKRRAKMDCWGVDAGTYLELQALELKACVHTCKLPFVTGSLRRYTLWHGPSEAAHDIRMVDPSPSGAGQTRHFAYS